MQALSSKANIYAGAFPVMGKLLILFLFTSFAACRQTQKKNTLFKKIPSFLSGIDFNNRITETDSVNPLDMDFLYHGGGVAVGDFNNDGLQDLYFTGSETSNKLYLNKGDLVFSDVTHTAHAEGQEKWCTSAVAVDINNDHLLDLYVCASVKGLAEQRTNILYINQGPDKNGVPVFKDMAAEYGLADPGFSTVSSFFDYDNDGDLDLYLVTTKNSAGQSMRFSANNNNDTTTGDYDKLYANNFNPSLGHPVFTDVSRQAGVQQHGYGLGVSIADINNDGWKDVYVTNDYYTSDVLLINNHDGTFTDKLPSYAKHISQNAMGVDIADINNDGLPDILTLDMNPESNFRKKKNMGGNNYYIYQSMLSGKSMLQYIRNTLQINMGPRHGVKDFSGDPIFAEVGFYAGVAETDWSWNPSLADVDNDGLRDILITNGYPRDITDHDFWAFRDHSANASKQEIVDQIPRIKIANYAFKNTGDCTFRNTTSDWGLDESSYSSGAIYADLDNDGDLDYVVNNINQEAFLYENTLNTKNDVRANFLEINFKGSSPNPAGIGAIATIYYDGQIQRYENAPVRGYLSMVAPCAFFGLAQVKTIDSLVVQWTGARQVLFNVAVNRQLIVKESDARSFREGVPAYAPLFSDITTPAGITYVANELDWIDFNQERLLPHKLSEYGPALASGDLDHNGLDDLVIGGTGDYPAVLLMQQSDGRFIQRSLPFPQGTDVRRPETVSAAVFDADNDGDMDLYFANGSNEFLPNTKNYQDRLFLNNGKAEFAWDTAAVPVNFASKSCVRVCDYDHDGDQDLFIGGRVIPGSYPAPASSCLLRNDSRGGHVKFTDVTDSVAPVLKNIGLVTDALWSDFDQDGFPDLMIAGEWMPLTVLANKRGAFTDITGQSGLQEAKGWWNSLAAADVDGDGDTDYFAGNLGLNSFYRASEKEPVSIYAKDFDGNGSLDAVPVLYLPDEHGTRRPYPAQNRDDVVEQLPGLKKRFLTYKQFATATINELFTADELKGALVLHANEFRSSYIENLGKGKFRLHPLPWQAQLAPVYGMVAGDFNSDGRIDLALCGNDYGTEVAQGRYDALNGLVMLGDGRGQFSVQSIQKSGIFIPGNARGLVSLKSPKGQLLLAAVQNRGPLRLFKLNEFVSPEKKSSPVSPDTLGKREIRKGQ